MTCRNSHANDMKRNFYGFNLLGMFCRTKMENGDRRIFGHFPEDRFVMSDGWKWGQVPVMELHPFDSLSGESIHCYEPHRVTHYKVHNPDEPGPCPPWPPEGCVDGVEWLERNFIESWRPAINDGTFLHLGEFGCHQGNVPPATYLAWLEDVLKMCRRHGWGWALWNLDGTFGILDTPRTDCEFEDFRGHRLDRKALDLLRKYKT